MRVLTSVVLKMACVALLLFVAGCDGDNGITGPTPPPQAPSPPGDGGGMGDVARGGLLYDSWWTINGAAEPTSSNPGYPGTGTQSGSTTWRCKECHGWDYQGVDGAYGSGSHFTGIAGVLAAKDESAESLFDQIRMGGNHDFSGVLSDQDVADLVEFVQMGTLDMNTVINFDSKQAMGNVESGQTLWSGAGQCSNCHGADGRGNVTDVPADAKDNPWEVLHKIRWGHPGSSMGSGVELGLSLSDQVDILAYSQSLP